MDFMLLSSLQKVFPHKKPEAGPKTSLTLLKNQRGAFQIVWKGENLKTIHIDISGLPCLTAYEVVCLPSAYPCHETVDENYLSTDPGLYPDLLRPVSLREITCTGLWQSVWISLQNLTPGHYSVRVSIEDTVQILDLTVRAELLPPQTLYHTEWFHGDCLADYYGVEVFSEKHWQAIEGFLKGAADCGVNMILTPIFTPPLDTRPGGERTTIQLVDAALEHGRFTFGFQKLRRWISLCRKYGITELEISHLFTQWGAAAAPKILVKENGRLLQKFGWDTPATDPQYTRFLRRFLSALRVELTALDLWEHTWFHISDEPSEDQKDSYEAAKNSIKDLLPEERCIDALSSFDFYGHGIIKRPVVCEDHLEPFLKAGVKDLFTYYCTAQGLEVPNRFFSMPSGRNRILGTLLYIYELRGFLHWGLNFYNSQFSLKHIDPFKVTDAGGAFPSGDPFLLYPAPDCSAWPSIRSEVLREGLQDLRLLHLAEQKAGRQTVLETIEKTAGFPMDFKHYPIEEAFFDRLQDEILKLI